MNRRGTSMLLLLTLVAVVGTAGWVTTNLVAMNLAARPADDVRVQTLWLARSALDAGVTGRSLVQTPLGPATVDATHDEVTVELRGARATVTASPWQERFAAASGEGSR